MFPSGVAPLPFSKIYLPSSPPFFILAITYVPAWVLRNMGEPGSEYTSSEDRSNRMRGGTSSDPGEITHVLIRLVLNQDSYTKANESSHQEIPLQIQKTRTSTMKLVRPFPNRCYMMDIHVRL